MNLDYVFQNRSITFSWQFGKVHKHVDDHLQSFIALAFFSFAYTESNHEEFLCEELHWTLLFWNHALFLLNLAQLLDRQFSAEFELYDYLLVFICGFFFPLLGAICVVCILLQLQGYLEFPFFPMIYSAQAQDCYSSQMDRQNHTWQSSQKLYLLLAGLLRLYSDEMELSQIMDSLSQPAPLLGKELDNFLGVLNHQV